jgi:uncharacterized membrane protein
MSSKPGTSVWKNAGLTVVFVWFFIGGITHFALTEFYLRIVPPYIPFPLAAVYISGVFELIGALGILSRNTRPLAGIGLMVLTVLVTPANIYMAQHPELFPNIPFWMLIARLPLQVLLLWLILWSTRPAGKRINV